MSIHSTIDPCAPAAMPANAAIKATDSINAETLPEVRRGAWMRLSAASAPSTGRRRVSSGRSALASVSASTGPSSTATAIVSP